MRKIIKNINEISDQDVFAIPHAVSDGSWVRGFYQYLAFEAKVDDVAHCNGINEGRVTYLDIVVKSYTEDNTFTTNIARFCDGEWLIRPYKADTKKTIEALVSHLEKLPYHEEFETEKQTA